MILEKNKEIHLSKRETEILTLILDGYTNIKIAQQLHLSINTVKAHITSLLYKLNAQTRLQAVLKAIKLNIIELK